MRVVLTSAVAAAAAAAAFRVENRTHTYTHAYQEENNKSRGDEESLTATRRRLIDDPEYSDEIFFHSSTNFSFSSFQVTICDEYQDPVDLIAELKTSHALSGSDGCLEDMYSTPYASMNLGECLSTSRRSS